MFAQLFIDRVQGAKPLMYPDGSGAKLAMSQTPELSLLQQIQAGNEEALIALHGRYANLVYSVAYRILDDGMSAEEVTQDTFLRLWNKSHRYDPDKGKFVTWLLTLTRRVAIDMLRQRKRQPPQQTPSSDDIPELWEEVLAADAGESSELRRTLLAVMDELPSDQRKAIELAYFYGMSHTDIAEYLTLPLGTVKTRIRQGMQKLRLAWISETPVNPKDRDQRK